MVVGHNIGEHKSCLLSHASNEFLQVGHPLVDIKFGFYGKVGDFDRRDGINIVEKRS